MTLPAWRPPPLPPLSPDEEANWIGREVIFEGEVLPGKTSFGVRDYILPVPYNPEWVSMDVRPVYAEDDGRTEVRAISFWHECVEERPSPYFDISTLDEWGSLLNRPAGEYPRIDPVPADVFAEMVESSDEWPPEYRDAFFTTPELDAREHKDGSGQMEPALYMRWGPEGESVRSGEYNAAAWDYVYGRASDLSGVELEFSVHAPAGPTEDGIWKVSINLIDADGDWREWVWDVGASGNKDGKIPACQWTTVQLIPSTDYSNYNLQRSAFEGGRGDGRVDLTRVTMIRFDENGVWTEELPFPLDDGWVWNAWNHIRVVPIRDVDIEENLVGLVAYYAFENDTTDSSVNGLDGVVIGDPVFVDGVEGMALDFNGDDYVDCGNDTLFDITDAFTLSVWINWRATGATWQTVIAKGDNAWRLARGADTQTMDFGFTAGGDRGWLAARTASDVPLGEWHHVTATIDTIDGAKIYLDGVLEGTNPDTGGITVGDYPVFIGENPQAAGRFWDGLVDEVMIYNRTLSDGEIRYLAGLR